MENTLLHNLLHYGEVLADYEFEDKEKGFVRIKQIEDTAVTKYIFTIVQINGEYVSVAMNMEF